MESYVNLDQSLFLLREDGNSLDWDDETVCLKRLSISDSRSQKKRVEKSELLPTLSQPPVTNKTPMKPLLSLKISGSKGSECSSPRVEVMSQQELVKCKDINRKLMSQDEGVAFNTPVDPVALRVPTYPTVIKYPMDLGTIKRKLGDKKYTTKDEFYMDVILTFQDAIYFNHPESEVHHWAVKLEGLFLKLWTTAFGATKPTAVDPRLPIALSQTVGTAPLEPLTPLYSLLNPSETGIEKNKAKTKKSSKRGEKIFTDAELQKLKCDLKTIEKDKEKMRRVFEIIRVDRKGKAEVSISLKSCTNEQLKELQEVVGLKSDGNKKVEEELEKLTGTQSIGKPQKAMDSESESELSSSCSADSPKSN